MTALPDREPLWRRAATVFSALEALAVAVWLVPASIHIVQWPASGPVRLALMAPAWQLGAWMAAGFLIAAALAMRQRNGTDTLADFFVPFSLLWLWAVPY